MLTDITLLTLAQHVAQPIRRHVQGAVQIVRPGRDLGELLVEGGKKTLASSTQGSPVAPESLPNGRHEGPILLKNETLSTTWDDPP